MTGPKKDEIAREKRRKTDVKWTHDFLRAVFQNGGRRRVLRRGTVHCSRGGAAVALSRDTCRMMV